MLYFYNISTCGLCFTEMPYFTCQIGFSYLIHAISSLSIMSSNSCSFYQLLLEHFYSSLIDMRLTTKSCGFKPWMLNPFSPAPWSLLMPLYRTFQLSQDPTWTLRPHMSNVFTFIMFFLSPCLVFLFSKLTGTLMLLQNLLQVNVFSGSQGKL